MTNKITKDQITAMSKQQAEANARRVNDAVIVPVYVSVSLDDEGRVSGVSNVRLNDAFGKVLDRPDVPFTEGQYQTFKALSKELEANSVDAFGDAYKALQDFMNSISEETLYLMRERYESEIERPNLQDVTPKYSDAVKKYGDDLKRM